MAGGSAPGASLVARVLAVLGAFDDRHRQLSLKQIADRADLPPATALRIVRELAADGALVRGDDRAYRIGRRLWDLGLLAPVETDLRAVAAPFLQDLHAATRATVHLAVREGDSALYLDRLSGRASVPVVSRAGARLPLHATGVGKILLAYAPPDVVRRVLTALSPQTPYTITAPGLLTRQLARARSDGYATTSEEMTLGACSIAVPVNIGPEVAASIGVIVPGSRRDRARLVTALTMAARGIGSELNRESLPTALTARRVRVKDVVRDLHRAVRLALVNHQVLANVRYGLIPRGFDPQRVAAILDRHVVGFTNLERLDVERAGTHVEQ